MGATGPRFALACAACVLAACSGAHDLPPTLGSVTFSLSVSVPDPSGGTMPLVGAAVAVDWPGGGRQEKTTGSAGEATFEPGGAPFSFTVAAPGYVAVTEEGLATSGTLTLSLQPFGADPTWADLSGVVRGKESPDHFVDVSTTIPSTAFAGTGPEYDLRVTPGEAFSLIVSENTFGASPQTDQSDSTLFFAWTEFSSPARRGASTMDLDLIPGDFAGTSLAPLVANGTLILPASMPGATGHVFVSSRTTGGQAFLGGISQIGPDSSGQNLSFTAEYVNPPDVTDLYSTYWLSLGGAQTFTQTDGAPGGTQTFLDPPMLASPQTLYGPLPIQSSLAGASNTEFVLISRDDSTIAWTLYTLEPIGSGITMPRLPSAIDPRAVLGTGAVFAVPEDCRIGAGGLCSAYAIGTPAELVSP